MGARFEENYYFSEATTSDKIATAQEEASTDSFAFSAAVSGSAKAGGVKVKGSASGGANETTTATTSASASVEQSQTASVSTSGTKIYGMVNAAGTKCGSLVGTQNVLFPIKYDTIPIWELPGLDSTKRNRIKGFYDEVLEKAIEDTTCSSGCVSGINEFGFSQDTFPGYGNLVDNSNCICAYSQVEVIPSGTFVRMKTTGGTEHRIRSNFFNCDDDVCALIARSNEDIMRGNKNAILVPKYNNMDAIDPKSFAQDADGVIYAISNDNKIYKVNGGNSFTLYMTIKQRIEKLIIDRKGNMYVTFLDSAENKYRPGKIIAGSVVQIGEVKLRNNKALYIDDLTGTLYAVGVNKYVSRYIDGKWKIYHAMGRYECLALGEKGFVGFTGSGHKYFSRVKEEVTDLSLGGTDGWNGRCPFYSKSGGLYATCHKNGYNRPCVLVPVL